MKIRTTDASLTEDVPRDAIVRLLTEADLPTSDIAPGPAQRFIGARCDGEWCGVVGIEPLGEYALMRSLAVTAGFRSEGLGRRLVAAAEKLAAELGAREIYLLSINSAMYFETLGYARVERDAVAAEVRATTQFTALCPATAAIMSRRIGRMR